MAVFLVVTVLIASLMSVSIAQIQICGFATDYDIDTLRMQPMWTAGVQADECVYGNDTSRCIVQFAVCRVLPEGNCNPRGAFTAFCQEVISTDGDIQYYDTGKMDLIVNEANGSNGFQFIYKNGASTDNCVNDTTSTIVFFQCDPTAQWDSSNPNVTRFVDYFYSDPLDECLFLMALNYSGACVSLEPILPTPCHLDNYDLETLSQPTAWLATVNSNKCLGVASQPETTCDLLFSFCKHLPLGQCYNSVFCQSGSTPYSFGEFNEDIKIIENDDQEGFTITYTNGTITTQCPAGLFSTLVFTCDPNAVWDVNTDQGYTNITKYILAEPSFSDCEYVVRFNYSGACFSSMPSLSPSSSMSMSIKSSEISPTITSAETVTSTGVSPSVTSTGVSPSATATVNPTVAPQPVSNVKWIVIPIVLVVAVGAIVLVVTVVAVLLFRKRRKGIKNSNINYKILEDKEDDINT